MHGLQVITDTYYVTVCLDVKWGTNLDAEHPDLSAAQDENALGLLLRAEFMDKSQAAHDVILTFALHLYVIFMIIVRIYN